MTSEDAPAASPWLTTWFKPRQSITHVINADPRHHVWLLAALGLIFGIILQLLVNGWTTVLLDWRAIAGIVIGGAILGVIGLYYSGFFFRWAGTLFGGHASAVAVRAALAWGQLPTVLGGTIGLVIGLLLLSAGVSNLVIGIIAAVAWFWTLGLTWLMFARVQNFGFWRTIISAGLGWVSSLSVLLLFALAFKALAFQPFNMPSGSMMPTLRVGDYFFVSERGQQMVSRRQLHHRRSGQARRAWARASPHAASLLQVRACQQGPGLPHHSGLAWPSRPQAHEPIHTCCGEALRGRVGLAWLSQGR